MKQVGWSSIFVGAVLLAVALLAEAQQPKKVPRIGFLAATRFRRARTARRLSGKDCASLVTWRGKTSSLNIDRQKEKSIGFPDLAAELVHLKVDVIVAAGAASTRRAKEATATIPIVMAIR